MSKKTPEGLPHKPHTIMKLTVDRENFPARLKKVREARGYSQISFSETLKVSRAAVSYWERGVSLPENERCEVIAEILDVPFTWLMAGEGAVPDLNGPKIKAGRKKFRIEAEPPSASWSERPNEPPFDGAVAEVPAGVGAGDPYSGEELVSDWWRLPVTLIDELHTKTAKTLRIMRVRTKTMEPLIARHSYVVIDLGQAAPAHGVIFALDMGHSVILKKLTLEKNDEIGLADGDEVVGMRVPLKKLPRILGRCVGKFDTL
jgi:transcriptional regulator with XRE-family HTH domain